MDFWGEKSGGNILTTLNLPNLISASFIEFYVQNWTKNNFLVLQVLRVEGGWSDVRVRIVIFSEFQLRGGGLILNPRNHYFYLKIRLNPLLGSQKN